MHNKRKNYRLSIDIPVKIRYNGVTVPARSRNLSCGGIFIQTQEDDLPNGACQLTLFLPDGKGPLVVNSQTVWTDQGEPLEAPENPSPDASAGSHNGGGGLEFQSLNPEQKERINEFIARNTRETLH